MYKNKLAVYRSEMSFCNFVLFEFVSYLDDSNNTH